MNDLGHWVIGTCIVFAAIVIVYYLLSPKLIKSGHENEVVSFETIKKPKGSIKHKVRCNDDNAYIERAEWLDKNNHHIKQS